MSDSEHFKCSCKNCGGHIEFPAAAAGMSVPCPHCQFPTELLPPNNGRAAAAPERRGRAAIFLGLTLVLLAGAGGYGYWKQMQSASPHESVATNTTIPKPVSKPAKSLADLKLATVTIEKTKGSGLIYAVGTMQNDSDHQRFGVRVEFDLLDAGGAKLGTSTDYTQLIEPRAEWTFRALVLDAKAVTAKPARIQED